jgi:hypothetical protein
MKFRMKQVLSGVLIAALAGAIGFYFGISYGAKIIGTMATQNALMSSLRSAERSLDALERNDAISFEKEAQINLRIALFEIGSQARLHLPTQCNDHDVHVLQQAKTYLEAHKNLDWFKPNATFTAALQFCDVK